MNAEDKFKAIIYLMPKVELVMRGDEIEWINPTKNPFTDKQINDAILEVKKSERLYMIKQNHANYLIKLTGAASIEERDTWAIKASAALAYPDCSKEDLEMLQSEAQLSELSIEELVAKILAKSNGYKKIVGLAAGYKKKAEILIKSANNTVEMDEVLMQIDQEIQSIIGGLNG